MASENFMNFVSGANIGLFCRLIRAKVDIISSKVVQFTSIKNIEPRPIYWSPCVLEGQCVGLHRTHQHAYGGSFNCQTSSIPRLETGKTCALNNKAFIFR